MSCQTCVKGLYAIDWGTAVWQNRALKGYKTASAWTLLQCRKYGERRPARAIEHVVLKSVATLPGNSSFNETHHTHRVLSTSSQQVNIFDKRSIYTTHEILA